MYYAHAKEGVQAHIGSNHLCCPSVKVQQTTPKALSMLLEQTSRQPKQLWHPV